MWVDTKYRSNEEEIMDDLDMEGGLLIDTLDKIASINKWLGGNRLTVQGVNELIKSHTKSEITIVDLGCGNGDMLRELADVGRNKKLKLKLIGIDANQATIDYAVKLSTKYSNISYMKLDVLSDAFNNIDYDIALSTLFLHHFKNDVALNLMKSLVSKARIGVIVNDLHRHALAYYLFKFITLFINNRMVKKDGLISILRGFRRKELEQFAEQINSKSQIKWKWAFRYQWITYK